MITVIIGTNALARRQKLAALIASFAQTHGATAIEQYDAEQLTAAQLPNTLQAMPFLSDKRLVIIRDVSQVKLLAEALPTLLPTMSEATDLVIVESHPDKRTAFYKFLLKQPKVHICDEVEGYQLTNWLVETAIASGGSIAKRDAEYLIERVGAQQQLLANELDKLLSYSPEITRKTIDLLTERSPQGTVFELLDAAFSGNAAKVLHLYRTQRQQRVEPLAIIGMIGWQLHILAIVKSAGARDPSVIAREAKLNPYVVRKSAQLVRNVSLARLKEWVRATLALEVEVKSRSIAVDDAVQHLLLSFTVTK